MEDEVEKHDLLKEHSEVALMQLRALKGDPDAQLELGALYGWREEIDESEKKDSQG